MRKSIQLAVILCLMAQFSWAQVPSWAVTPSNYTYSMNVTTKLSLNCVDLTDPSDMIGAFVGTECRGVTTTSNIVNGNYLAFLTVYSNSSSGETITFKIYDASADVEYDAITEVLFQDGASYGFPATPFTVSNNNEPTDISLSSNTVNENELNALVGTLTSVDADAGSSFTYSFVSGTGDTDNGSFNIAGDQLSAQGSLNYESNNGYSIRIETNDGGCSFEKTFVINVNDLNDSPTGITIDNSAIDEDVPSGTVVGNLYATDEDASDSHIYTLVAGTGDMDNGQFIITNNQLRTSGTYDYETQNSFSIRVQTSDNNNDTYEEVFTITLNDLNDAPTDLTPSTTSFMENKSIGSVILSFTTTDADANDAHTYSFDNAQSSDNSLFTIIGSDLRTAAEFDYETQSYYTIRVSTFDIEGASFTKQIILQVTDSNDVPTDLSLSNASIFENASIGTFVGKFTTEDQDATDSYTYSLVAGNGDTGNGAFAISNDSIFTNLLFDYNAQNEYYIRLQTADAAGETHVKRDTIHIKNSNDAPTDISLSNNTLEENQSSGTFIGLLSTSDPDVGDGHTYSFVTGMGSADNALFQFNSNELLSNYTFDFEAQDTFNIRIKTEDFTGASYEKQFEIIVLDANDSPSEINMNTDSVSENLPVNTVVIALSTVDQDTANTHSYSFDNSQTNDNDAFVLVGNEIKTATQFDYETQTIYYIYLTTNDGNGGTYTTQKTIYVIDENDAPTSVNLTNNSFDENNAPNTFVSVISTEDQDNGDSHTYTLVTGTGSTDNGSFNIIGDSLFVVDSANYEVQSTYSILVETTDNNGLSFQQQHTIVVSDANDIPTNIEVTLDEIDENNEKLVEIGNFFTTDEDQADAHTYVLVSGTGDDDNTNFFIEGTALKIKVNTNYEEKDSYSVLVRTNDNNGGLFEKAFTITVNDLNEAPVINDTTLYVSESAELDHIIGELNYSDVDANENHLFDVVDNNNFYTDLNEVVLDTELNYETGSSYSIQVVIEDNGGLMDTADVDIVVLDEIEPDLPLPVNKMLSPNGDDKNDLFYIENVDIYADYSLKIFNNNGFVIFEMDANYDNSWDGTYNGNMVEQGVYYYLLQNNNDASVFYKGSISIIR